MSCPLVEVRTPTYRRPDSLKRALGSLVGQSWSNWRCIVFDDDSEGSAAETVASFHDERIAYVRNTLQKFASGNIDQCFSSSTWSGEAADYFFILEDDNYVFPDFISENIRDCERHGADLVLRNQVVEHASGTPQARLTTGGILDNQFVEGLYDPPTFRAALLFGIGVSNGGLFWSRQARSPLEIGFACTATLQEFLRTYAIVEPVYVAMKPLAVWADNGEQTTRNLGGASYRRRELDLKKSVQDLQRQIWASLPLQSRREFLATTKFRAPRRRRAEGLTKALLTPCARELGARRSAELILRGSAIGILGRTSGDFRRFVATRGPNALSATPALPDASFAQPLLA